MVTRVECVADFVDGSLGVSYYDGETFDEEIAEETVEENEEETAEEVTE
jgi:hypothetical protein